MPKLEALIFLGGESPACAVLHGLISLQTMRTWSSTSLALCLRQNQQPTMAVATCVPSCLA